MLIKRKSRIETFFEKNEKFVNWIENKLDNLHQRKIEKIKNKVRKKKLILNELNNEKFLTEKDKKKIIKLEEEIIKMAKLILKDGKLQRSEETTESVQSNIQPPIQNHIQPNVQNHIQPNVQHHIQPNVQHHIQPTIEEEIVEEEIIEDNNKNNEMDIMSQQEQLMEQELQKIRNAKQIAMEQLERQKLQQQSQHQVQKEEEEVGEVNVAIEFTNQTNMIVNIETKYLNDFFEELSSAVSDAATLRVGDVYINCRHVLRYYISSEVKNDNIQ